MVLVCIYKVFTSYWFQYSYNCYSGPWHVLSKVLNHSFHCYCIYSKVWPYLNFVSDRCKNWLHSCNIFFISNISCNATILWCIITSFAPVHLCIESEYQENRGYMYIEKMNFNPSTKPFMKCLGLHVCPFLKWAHALQSTKRTEVACI